MNVTNRVLGILLLCTAACATEQFPEYIIYRTRFKRLYSEPLEQYKWPKGENPWLCESPGMRSTGLLRGYTAPWEVDEGRLFLRAIDASIRMNEARLDSRTGKLLPAQWEAATLSRLFPGRVQGDRVSAVWYTGILRIPDGKILRTDPNAYPYEVHEREILISVHEGTIVKTEIKKNETEPVEDKAGRQEDPNE